MVVQCKDLGPGRLQSVSGPIGGPISKRYRVRCGDGPCDGIREVATPPPPPRYPPPSVGQLRYWTVFAKPPPPFRNMISRRLQHASPRAVFKEWSVFFFIFVFCLRAASSFRIMVNGRWPPTEAVGGLPWQLMAN